MGQINRAFALALGSALAFAAQASAADQEGAVASSCPAIIHPKVADFTRLASGNDFASNYPAGAVANRVSAKVVVECQARTDGSFDQCKISSDDRPEYGFDQATAKVMTKFRLSPKSLAETAPCPPDQKPSYEMTITWRID